MTVSDLDNRFQAAVANSTKLSERPDNDTMLKLYALYKQGTQGDCSGKRPGMLDPVGRAKYDAWAKRKGMSTEDAKAEYADLVESLR